MNTYQLLLCCSLLLFLILKIRSQSFTRIIKTPSGSIQGTVVIFLGHTVDQFLGIPFAQPPIGRLRFRKTHPVKPWTTILTADKEGPACIQHLRHSYPVYGFKSEDCLYLNIWVPRSNDINNDKTKIPVMFFIYGGAFTIGSINVPVYNGGVLAAKGKIIVVTINYRLSTLGFFTTDTEDAPGNAAMYDILEALKWVNKNIGAFGGDPDRVTLVGQSSGAVTVGMLCTSPLTKGLFRRIIMESGSPATIVYDNSTINLYKSQKVAKETGCADDDTTVFNNPKRVVECMREKNPYTINKPMESYPIVIRQSIYPNYGDEILPFNAREAIISGRFHNSDVLIGNVHDEGSIRLLYYNTTYFGQFGMKQPKININHAVSIMKDIFKEFYFKDDIIQYYLGSVNSEDYDKIREKVYTAIGDFCILCPTEYFAERYSRHGNNVYYYFFVHRSSATPFAKWMKVAHFEEVPFVFGKPLLYPEKYSEAEVILSLRLIRIWSNFVKTGSPENPIESTYPESKWPLYSKESPVYVRLGAEIMKNMKGYGRGPYPKNCNFFRPYLGFL